MGWNSFQTTMLLYKHVRAIFLAVSIQTSNDKMVREQYLQVGDSSFLSVLSLPLKLFPEEVHTHLAISFL